VNSGQHPATVARTFAGFGITCDVELAHLPPLPNMSASCRCLESRLREVIERIEPAVVVVQGDTLTAYAGARAGGHAGFPVAHIEAGLRTDDAADPFPEEIFRRRIAWHSSIHFAPCRSAAQNLLIEGADPASIHCVGNTGIDSLRELLQRQQPRVVGGTHHTLLVTLHRRENLDANADVMCEALLDLSALRPDLQVVFPVHPNPRSALRIRRRLGGHPAFRLVDPMNYPDFIAVALSAALLISDSGGLQEEAPHLGVPLLVPRVNTERPEGVETGFVRLVSVERSAVVLAALEMLAKEPMNPLPFDDAAPFGDGEASARIASALDKIVSPSRLAISQEAA
jgi:UDP-N-acetylglucosamine 2-epimerase (non-hydrolysing)